MERGVGWCLVLLIPGLLARLGTGGSPSVVIDGYTNSDTPESGASVPLGTQLILVCQVVGLPFGTPFSYTWTCPNGPCEVEGHYGRKVYNEHILAVTTTSTSDGGTYTCQVTPTGGQEANGSFTLSVAGGSVVHSYGRLIPHEFPITDLQQISGPDGIGRITCTVSIGTAIFGVNGGRLETGGVSQTRNGATATLVVNLTDVGSFQNRPLYCTNIDTNFFYLFISSANSLNTPKLNNSVTGSTVTYSIDRNNEISGPMIAGYEVFRMGMAMIGRYDNTPKKVVTISPAVPGAQYRITAWALGDDGSRSVIPAVLHVTTGEAKPLAPRTLLITRVFEDGIELNWLPPTEPNGEVHYVIYSTPEGGTEQSNHTESNLTHYNLTGFERNRVYTNIAVQAVNSAGMSDRSAVIAQYNHTPPDLQLVPEKVNTALTVGVVVFLLVVVLLIPVMVVVVVVAGAGRMRKKGEKSRKVIMLCNGSEEKMKAEGNPGSNETNHTIDDDHNTPVDHDQSTLSSRHYAVAYAFTNPATDTTAFGADTYNTAYYSEVGQVHSAESSTKLKWGGQGQNEEEPQLGRKRENKPDYTEPDISTKGKEKEDMTTLKEETVSVGLEHVYAQPDMAMKKERRSQQRKKQEAANEGSRVAPQPPLPIKKHREMERVVP